LIPETWNKKTGLYTEVSPVWWISVYRPFHFPVLIPASYLFLPWHFLYFLPLPQGQGSLRPTFGAVRAEGLTIPD
jgi:hypothetical protein